MYSNCWFNLSLREQCVSKLALWKDKAMFSKCQDCEAPGISQARFELEMNSDLKVQLWEFNITMAKVDEVGGGHNFCASSLAEIFLENRSRASLWIGEKI